MATEGAERVDDELEVGFDDHFESRGITRSLSGEG